MDTRSLVDPEILPLIDMLPPLQFTSETLPQVHTALGEMMVPMAVESAKRNLQSSICRLQLH